MKVNESLRKKYAKCLCQSQEKNIVSNLVSAGHILQLGNVSSLLPCMSWDVYHSSLLPHFTLPRSVVELQAYRVNSKNSLDEYSPRSLAKIFAFDLLKKYSVIVNILMLKGMSALWHHDPASNMTLTTSASSG